MQLPLPVTHFLKLSHLQRGPSWPLHLSRCHHICHLHFISGVIISAADLNAFSNLSGPSFPHVRQLRCYLQERVQRVRDDPGVPGAQRGILLSLLQQLVTFKCSLSVRTL